MWLYDGDYLSFGGRTGGFQNGGDFNRVMAVIIDNNDAIDLADTGKAPLDTFKGRQRTADNVFPDANFNSDGNCRQRVLHVVFAQHGERQILERLFGAGLAVGDMDIKPGGAG